ncbi:MAG: Gfo/Idh/MocA family oxidoreductase [Rhodobacteraceae bacterium]|nr:MAG: Gfo/Idh/MocA family oxidoreductase [Paracoccaceae bacterium]
MNWALIGASTIASQYMIAAIRAQQAGEVTWVVSGTRDRAETYARDHGIARATADLDEALRDPSVGAAYISSTNEKHEAQARAAIAAGKHVLCEKPLATSVEGAVAMVRAARDAGLVFATNHHLRCAGSHRAIREMVQGGSIGEVLSMRVFHAVHLPEHLRGWRLDNPGAGGGAILDLTVHNADTVRFILGADPQAVSGQMGVSGMGQGVEDSAMSVWTMPSGAMVMSHESFTHPFAASGLEVHGTEGSILARGVLSQDPEGEIELVNAEGRKAVPFDPHPLYPEAVRQFCAAVAGDGSPAASGLDGVRSLQIALAVRTSAQNGVRQSIQYEDIA